jgi:site-specific recombinase XerD
VNGVLEYVGAQEGSLRYRTLSKNSWRTYRTGLRRWLAFAQLRGVSALEPDVNTLADCIEHYDEAGVTASALDKMCTAVSTIFA